MDKLENETWEEYAFRNNLFVIKYADKEKMTIDDITIPIHTNVDSRHTYSNDYHSKVNYSSNTYTKIGFMDFIMHEIYNLRDKYKTGCYGTPISKVELMTKEREEDIHRQNWLFKQMDYWENKSTEKTKEILKERKEKDERLVDVKKRYFELKATISESHKEQLDELLAIVRGSSIPLLEGIYSEKKDWREEREKENTQKKKERVELYQKYLKNKEIQTQIMELEQKLNQLKSQIVR
jgi:hypothetical protein